MTKTLRSFMRTWLLLPWLAGLAVAGSAPATPADRPAAARAVWVWEEDSYRMLDDEVAASKATR